MIKNFKKFENGFRFDREIMFLDFYLRLHFGHWKKKNFLCSILSTLLKTVTNVLYLIILAFFETKSFLWIAVSDEEKNHRFFDKKSRMILLQKLERPNFRKKDSFTISNEAISRVFWTEIRRMVIWLKFYWCMAFIKENSPNSL